MGKLLVLKSKYLPEIGSLWGAFCRWWLAKFHVHRWEDEKVLEVKTSGQVTGHIYVQVCLEPGCKKRRSQTLTSAGIKDGK